MNRSRAGARLDSSTRTFFPGRRDTERIVDELRSFGGLVPIRPCGRLPDGRLIPAGRRLPGKLAFRGQPRGSVGAKGRCFLRLGLKLPEPSQRAEAGQKAILASPCDNKPGQSFETHGKWTPRKTIGICAAVRSRDGIFRGASSEEAAIVHPLRLDELELPPEIASNKSKH